MESWIERAARQRALRILGLCVVLTAATLSLYALDAEYWRTFFHGPTTVDAAALQAEAERTGPVRTPFAKVTGTRVLDSGVQEVTTEEGIYKHVTAGYYGLLVEDASGGRKVLMVKSSKVPETTVSGTLEGLPTDLEATLLEGDEDGSRRSTLYPLMLDQGEYRKNGGFAIFWGALFLSIVWFLGWRALQRLREPRRHPAVARAAKWGELGVISDEVQRELRGTVAIRHKGFLFTENYLVVQQLFRFNLFRLDDLVWLYHRVTKQRVNMIPVGVSHAAALYFADGYVWVPGRKKRVEAMLSWLRERAPWAIPGYDASLEQLYNKHLAELVAEVAERRQEVKAGRGQRPAAG